MKFMTRPSSISWLVEISSFRISIFRAISISKVALLILCRMFSLSEKKKQDFEKQDFLGRTQFKFSTNLCTQFKKNAQKLDL